MRGKKIKLFLAVLACLVSCAGLAQAAVLQMEVPTGEIYKDSSVEMAVVFNPENQVVNALSARIMFPEDKLELKDITTGGDSQILWVKPPAITGNSVEFSAVAPGGIRGRLFSIIATPKAVGAFALGQGSGEALLNDGQGTKLNLQILPVSLNVSSATSTLPSQSLPDDRIPPDVFIPKVARDPSIYDNNWFLVFSASDQGLGIKSYEVLETTDSKTDPEKQSAWKEAQSPYLLFDQTLKSQVYVKAVDKAGNFTIIKVDLPKISMQKDYGFWLICGIILLAILLFVIKRAKDKMFPSAHHFYAKKDG